MESSNNLGTPSPESGVNQNDANEFSGSGTPGGLGASDPTQRSSFDFAGGIADQQGLKDRARNAIGSASDRLADVGSSVRDKAGNVKEKLANALESGAGKLRNRGAGDGPAVAGAALAGATTAGSTTVEGDGRITQVSDRVAGGMQATADWLREADIDGLKTGIERQVKEHPGRTLLIAAGLGYLIGRAFRGEK